MKRINRPKEGLYPPYFDNYIKLVEGEDILPFLLQQKETFVDFLNSQVKPKADYAYMDEKWTCQEVLGHLIDAERVFAYRAFFIARNDPQNLPGFDQDDYLESGVFKDRDFEDMVDEFAIVRAHTLKLLNSFRESDYSKTGKINNFTTVLSAIPYIIGGHIRHHERILLEKYRV